MLVATVKRTISEPRFGTPEESFELIEFDCPELENFLAGGGMSETAFDFRSLVGVSIRKEEISIGRYD